MPRQPAPDVGACRSGLLLVGGSPLDRGSAFLCPSEDLCFAGSWHAPDQPHEQEEHMEQRSTWSKRDLGGWSRKTDSRRGLSFQMPPSRAQGAREGGIS